MGWNYRKSIKIGGGFRINISKSGIGYSWGVPGYRITKTARGTTRRTVSIPGTGFSHTQETSNRQRRQSTSLPGSHVDDPIIDTQSQDIISDANLDEICNALNKSSLVNTLSTWIIILGIFFGFACPPVFIVAAIGLALKIYVRKCGVVQLDYKVEIDQQAEHEERLKFWDSLFQANRTWQVLLKQRNADSRNNFGAGKNVQRKSVSKAKSYKFISSNVEYITIKLNKELLIVLPDRLFVRQKRKFRAVDYNSISIRSQYCNFVESQKVPSDTQVIRMAWEHSNNDGSRDRRFSNNRQLPVCKYIETKIESQSGLLIVFLISDSGSQIVNYRIEPRVRDNN